MGHADGVDPVALALASLDPGSHCVHSIFALILFLQPPTTSFPGHSPPLSSFPAWCTSLQKFVTHVGRSSHSIQGANICSEVKLKPCERVPLGLNRFAGRWAMCWCTQGLKDGAPVHATEARRQPGRLVPVSQLISQLLCSCAAVLRADTVQLELGTRIV